MARFVRITREQAVEYLNTNENWRELRRNNRRIKNPEDMPTDLLRRYANGLRRMQGQGTWASDLAALRGHTASEHHKGRSRKVGYENWVAPERIPRMQSESMHFAAIDRQGRRVTREAHFTVTAGESVAVRALNLAIQRGETIALSLTGPLPGEHRFLFWKGGYDPRLLLEAAGYKPTRRGRYQRVPGTQGLEAWLLNYLMKLSGSPTKERWAFLSLYQIYAAEQITDIDLVVPQHQRTYYFPTYTGLLDLHNPFIAPTARPSLTGKSGKGG